MTYTTDTLKNDISVQLATAAHYATSFVPDKRAQQERDEYANTLMNDYANLQELVRNEEEQLILDAEFDRYRAGYRQRYTSYLGSRSRVMSAMIVGPANFPTRRNQKRSAVADKRLTELVEYRPKALAAIRKKLRPETAAIMTGDDNAVERLEAKIAQAEKLQEQMKAANAAIRKHKKAGVEAQIAALSELGIKREHAELLLQPDFCGRIGFADYELTNNNANIRRMKARLVEVSRIKSEETTKQEGEHAKVEINPAENRVRIFFPGKPDANIRATLKSAGFRWAPSQGCWSAYNNPRTVATANQVAGVQ